MEQYGRRTRVSHTYNTAPCAVWGALTYSTHCGKWDGYGDGDGDRVLRSPSPIPSPPAGCEFLCVQKKAISNKV